MPISGNHAEHQTHPTNPNRQEAFMSDSANSKFIDLSREQQIEEVRKRFQYREGLGWHTMDGSYAGANEDDVIAALIDLEEAEINAVGDCMSGFCMIQPKFEDFVRKPWRRDE
jgi:hypothetical protein